MAAPDNGRDGLGLALDGSSATTMPQQAAATAVVDDGAGSSSSSSSRLVPPLAAAAPPPHGSPVKRRPSIVTSMHDHAHASVDLTASPMVDSAMTPSQRIPPPPSPRRHRTGVIMSRVRAHSGGPGAVTPNRSFADLHAMGLSMTSVSPGPPPHRRASADSATSDAAGGTAAADAEMLSPGGTFPDEQFSPDGDGSHYDNSARFYHHLHSRAPSPTRSAVSGSPTARSPSPARAGGSSPGVPRRNATLPASGGLSPSASLSASLSPNSRFLQQHLPPTFPFAPPSHQVSPEVERENPIQNPLHQHHSMVILTPTTQEWRELKEIRRLEGDEMADIPSDSESGSSSGRSSNRSSMRSSMRSSGLSTTALASAGEIELDEKTQYAKAVENEGSSSAEQIEPRTPVHQVEFNPVIIAPSPLRWAEGDSHETDGGAVAVDEGDVIHELDENQAPGLAGLARFNSIGRQDSLRVRARPAVEEVPRPKTKRELERERLFAMVDQEIADGGAVNPNQQHNSWNIAQIGSGMGLDSRASFSHMDEGAKAAAAAAAAEAQAAQMPTLPQLVTTPDSPESTKSESPISPKIATPEVEPLQQPPQATAPVRPSPLHMEPPLAPSPGSATPRSPGGSAAPGITTSPVAITASPLGEINLASPDDLSPTDEMAPETGAPQTQTERYEAIRSYSRSMSMRRPGDSRAPSRRASMDQEIPSPPRSPRRRTTNRISLVAGRVVQPPSYPGLTPLSSVAPRTAVSHALQSFSPFRSPSLLAQRTGLTPMERQFSHAPSISVPSPSECTTPANEKVAGGVGGHGIDDYVIIKEAGKGAYGLVMRAKVKGANGEPVGDELIIKYIIKSRILADCWKKHKVLGPIPVEIHVLDQLRHLIYHPPATPHPWDSFRARPGEVRVNENGAEQLATPEAAEPTPPAMSSGAASRTGTPLGGYSAPGGGTAHVIAPRSVTPVRTDSGSSTANPTRRFISSEIKHSPERGHPNICKLLDFFEDREFYYVVMPRFGTGVDLFDRVESQPAGLEPFEVRSLVGQLTDALRFLHANGIVHRDIKDENVILDGDGRCQLIDFGSAAHWRPGKRWDTFSGTLHYASPEILRGEMYGGKEQDVWALGAVCYVLLVCETPFAELPDEVLAGLAPGSRAEEALEARCGGAHAMDGLEAEGGGALGDAADFVRRCLEMEQGERPTAEQLLGHRYLVGNGGWVGRKGWERK